MGADELAAEHALTVDDVGFGDLLGAVEGVDTLLFVADGDEVDVILDQEAVIEVGVLVDAYRDDDEIGHLALEREEAGELFNAGGAEGGPKVEDDDAAAKLVEVDGSAAVVQDELGCRFADVFGV